MQPTTELANALESVLRGYPATAVAFSGGVDSGLLAAAAHRALGDRAIAVLSDSPTLPRTELLEAKSLAEEIGIRLHVLERSELDDPRFVENPANRCYFCKEGLVEDVTKFASTKGLTPVSLGVNTSDLGDWRPGIAAARSLGARFPLVEAGFGKPEVRVLAHAWGLGVWDKPSSPCLASRVPYGQLVTHEKLGHIERAEAMVRAIGVRDVRVRHFGDEARIEVPSEDLPLVEAREAMLREAFRSLGFGRLVIDSRGLKSGRLNDELLGGRVSY